MVVEVHLEGVGDQHEHLLTLIKQDHQTKVADALRGAAAGRQDNRPAGLRVKDTAGGQGRGALREQHDVMMKRRREGRLQVECDQGPQHGGCQLQCGVLGVDVGRLLTCVLDLDKSCLCNCSGGDCCCLSRC